MQLTLFMIQISLRATKSNIFARFKTAPMKLKLLLFLCVLESSLYAQTATIDLPKTKNRSVYFAWGYNKDWFSKSTIHFTSGSNSDFDYNFKWIGVSAHDRTGFSDILSTDLAIPQYVYRIGYMFNKKKGWGVEFAFDHAKYIVEQNQKFHMQGTVKGESIDTTTYFPESYMHFEHTNGANFAMINLVNEKSFFETPNKKFAVNYIIKGGAGIVVPKTDVTLFGERLDNVFHVAGYIVGVEGGITINFWQSLYISPTFKTSYANYLNALTVDNGTASHSFFAYEAILVIGYKYNF